MYFYIHLFFVCCTKLWLKLNTSEIRVGTSVRGKHGGGFSATGQSWFFLFLTVCAHTGTPFKTTACKNSLAPISRRRVLSLIFALFFFLINTSRVKAGSTVGHAVASIVRANQTRS